MAEAGNSSVAASARSKGRSNLMVLRNGKEITRPEHIDPCAGKRPRFLLNFGFRGLVTDKDFRPYAHMALGLFNAEKVQKGRCPCYELVETRNCILTRAPTRFHFNFIARPENASDAENQLFFAEVKRDEITTPFYCSCCCIIGPPGTVTALNGCGLNCVNYRRHVQHPKDGFTTKPAELELKWS